MYILISVHSVYSELVRSDGAQVTLIPDISFNYLTSKQNKKTADSVGISRARARDNDNNDKINSDSVVCRVVV